MSKANLRIEMTPRQEEFIDATAFEVLYGGAAGGGKSYGQLIDALLYAVDYPGSKQLLLRQSFPELKRSLILTHYKFYPFKGTDGRGIYSYNKTDHIGTFTNGSIIEFAYCENDADVHRYQSAEYDVIRFDELTHFTEYVYTYLISRVRGANDFPKQIKSTTNPGGIGHDWVKKRFIDPAPPNTPFVTDTGDTRVFIPAFVHENVFLMKSDPKYVQRLKNLSEADVRALLYGDWDLDEGRYFSEFERAVHVIEPFPIPDYWRRYFTMDYGLDMLAGYWIAMDERGRAYVYREIYESGLIVSQAAERIKAMTDEKINARYAAADLWNRRQETGRSAADIFAAHGVPLVCGRNERVQGWYDLREWLKPFTDELGVRTAALVIFNNCRNLIRCLPALQHDDKNPNDVATNPHELTHAPDALRYFIAGRPSPTAPPKVEDPDAIGVQKQIDALLKFRG